ncbi:MAG TPA: NAD(P)-dependent oxidoreductase [bacterium]|nr:NAD(P)-dependent oxidoreductase [bacterium]HQL62315.1 NAD(P)-dependent oxidoreductase [bacterium]
MKVLVVGGTGHVGLHLVPKLLARGIQVTVLSSGRTRMPDDPVWERAQYVRHDYSCDSLPMEIKDVFFDTVIDMLGKEHTYRLFHTHAKHILVCGSTWMYGEPKVVPTPEQAQTIPCPFPSYARRFDHIRRDIRNAKREGIQFTAIMPPNICGPGKIPLEGMGGRSLAVHRAHAAGETVVLPEGAESLIGPCDADDIAELFVAAATNPKPASAEIVNVGSAYSLTATQFIRTIAEIYKAEIPIEYVPWEKYTTEVSTDIGAYWHFKAHTCPDIRKAARLLGYEPKYTPEQSLERAIRWMQTCAML